MLVATSKRLVKKLDSGEAADEVQLHFDWSPTPQNNRIVFQAVITRRAQHSVIDFEIRLLELSKSELSQLHAILS